MPLPLVTYEDTVDIARAARIAGNSRDYEFLDQLASKLLPNRVHERTLGERSSVVADE